MPEIRIGKVRLAFKGEWVPTEPYEALDTVTRNGESWAAITDVPAGVEPSINNPLFWAKAAAKGDQGPQGPVGPMGPEGPEGPQGEQGLSGASTWAEVENKPDTATRWPAFAEVTAKPATATRWPTFGEVTDKPPYYPVDPTLFEGFAPLSHTHPYVPLENADIVFGYQNGGLTLRTLNDAGDFIYQLRSVDGTSRFTVRHGASEMIGDATSWRIGSNKIVTQGVPVVNLVESVGTHIGSVIDATISTIWRRTLADNITFTSNLTSGQYQILQLVNGASYTVGWPSGIKWTGGSPPTLTAEDVIVFWNVSGILHGSYVGSVA